MSSRSCLRLVLVLAFVFAPCACSPARPWPKAPYDTLYQREPPPELHGLPHEIDPSDWLEAYYNNSVGQLGRLVSPGFYLQREMGSPDALDVNAFGKVPDSTWFRNRIGRFEMSAEQIQRGPNRDDGPALGQLTIVKAKVEGVTPGFFVEDERGVRWLVKFDAPAYPELNSAAEVISTKLLHALGYNVPENYVAHFHLSALEISPRAVMLDRYNRKQRFSDERLAELLALLNPEPDGRVRALFSRFLPGRPVGPFAIVGVRPDDPNDRIPHERRRSLRALLPFYAWLNNADAKVANTLDTFLVQDNERELGYLVHYLIDFGSSLGAAGHGLKELSVGYDYVVDWERIGRRYLSFGLYYPYWVSVKRTPYRGVGTFESQVFVPEKWRSRYPNVGLESANSQDWFWAAAILSHVRRSHIEAAVASGELTEPGAADWVAQVLWERRNKVVRHGFDHQAPLDDPILRGPWELCWTDLETLAFGEPTMSYAWKLRHEPGEGEVEGVAERTCLDLAEVLDALRAQVGEEALQSYPFVSLYVGQRAGDLSEERPRLAIDVRLAQGEGLVLVGLRRDCGAHCRQ